MQYHEWNAAICDAFTKRAVPGSLVYLNIDDALLRTLGTAAGIASEEAVTSFIDAVRQKLREGRLSGDEVSLAELSGHDENDRPRCVAFLAATVLAATRMGDIFNPLIYFGQLRNLFGFPPRHPGDDRLRGMPVGSEETLWHEWARFLATKNLLSSAKVGPDGPTKYTNYPISQTLLRHTDREQLKVLFGSMSSFQREIEPDLLMTRVFALRQKLTSRLHQKLSTMGSRERYVAWMQTIADLHDEFLRERIEPGMMSGPSANALAIEILRQPGRRARRGMDDTPPYFTFLVKLRAGFSFGSPGDHADEKPQIYVNDKWVALEADEENPSVTCPVAELTPAQIASGCEFPLRNAGSFIKAVLPKREFRLLFKDDDHPYSGIYQSGKPSGAGLGFVFLGSARYTDDLNRLKTIEKIHWKTLEPFGDTDWIQATEGQITHEDWTYLTAGDSDLRNALRPHSTVSVSISGGLRVGFGGYLPVNPPLLTVRGAAKSYPARAIALHNTKETTVCEWCVEPFTPQPIPTRVLEQPGIYRIEVGTGEEIAPRVLPVTGWDVLEREIAGSNNTPNRNPIGRMAWSEAVEE